MRWWWFGPSVSRPELQRELTAMAAAGLGGVEVAYVYPLSTATTEFGSDALLADLLFAAERAHELGLRFDLTLGSGWSFGGPHIFTQLAARQLHWMQREIGPGPLEVPVVSPWPGDELIAAYVGAGSLQEQPDSYERLTIVNGRLVLGAGTAPRVVLLAYARLTGQNVKRAAVGAEGPVLDHYSAAATESHLRAVGDPMLDAVPAELVGSVFCDSLEVYGSDWTPTLPEEFARRRGYDLLSVLYRLTVDEPDAARLRADYHRTLVELYEENFVAVCQRWAARRGVPFRIQGYATPPATISSYRFADLFEGEGWGWREITQTRWASSAAHLYGRSVVSAEVWTWVHSPSFRATPLDLKGEAQAPSSTASISSSATAGHTRRSTRRGSAGSFTPRVHSTTATPGGRRCPSSLGTWPGCAGCCGRANRRPTSRCTCPTTTCSRPWEGRRAACWTAGVKHAAGFPARSRRRSGTRGWTTTSLTTRRWG